VQMAHISIEDTGPGIPDELKKRIFELGFSTKPVGIGTGMGLSISRKIVVDRHCGLISFESEPGRGTTFHVRIPVRQQRPCAPVEPKVRSESAN